VIKLVFSLVFFSLIPLAFAQNDNLACNGLTDENPVIITTDKPIYTYYDDKVIVSICMSPDVYHKHIEMTVYDLQGNEMFHTFDPGFIWGESLEQEPYFFVQEVTLDSFEKWQKYTVELHASGQNYHAYFGYGADMFQEYFSEKYNFYIYPTTFWMLSPHTTDDVARFDAEAPSTIDTFPPYFEVIKLETNERIKFGDREKVAQLHTQFFENLAQDTIGRQLDFKKDIIITDTFATDSVFLHNIKVTMVTLDREIEMYSTAFQTDANEIFILTLYSDKAEVNDESHTEFIDSVNTFSPLNEKPLIPEWIRNVFVWYGAEQISESELISALQFMISNKIIEIEYRGFGFNDSQESIPEWIKNVFVWYGEGKVSELEVIDALKYLISEGIISV